MKATREIPLFVNSATVEDLPYRMWKKTEVDPGTGCWIWTGAVTSAGYGCGAGAAGSWLAHRRSYEMLAFQIPDGMALDHLCCTKLCINPRHLEPISLGDNVRRKHGVYSDETHWPCGHERTTANTKISRRGGDYPARQCKTCAENRRRFLNARAAHARRQAKKAA